MMVSISFLARALALIVAILTSMALNHDAQRRGIWAAEGRSFAVAPEITSPNRRFALRADDGHLSLVMPSRTVDLANVPITASLSEVMWAPDSSAFVVNSSDGGLVGTWDAYLFVLAAGDELTFRNLRQLLESHVHRFAKCSSDEIVNLGAVAWSHNGGELYVVVEVPPHSSCRNMGDLAGYRVSVRGWKVMERVAESKLRANWSKSLGHRFVVGR